MLASPKDIEMSCLNSPDDAMYNCEVLRDRETTLNITVTNRSEEDVLSLHYELLKHISVVKIRRNSTISDILPGNHLFLLVLSFYCLPSL